MGEICVGEMWVDGGTKRAEGVGKRFSAMGRVRISGCVDRAYEGAGWDARGRGLGLLGDGEGAGVRFLALVPPRVRGLFF